MEQKKKFQGKKLNKKENDSIKKAAKGVKDGAGLLMIGAVVVTGIKKYGKDVLKLGKNIIFKA